MKNNNIIRKKSFDFALDILDIIDLYKNLTTQNEFILSKEALRSGTSIGANVEEAPAGQSKKDFIAKMSLASKEARETKYWLKLLQESQIVEFNFTNYIKSSDEIISILTAIVKTSQTSIQNNSTLKT
jgi:four helix bundle protein